jgi:hypothetical protein
MGAEARSIHWSTHDHPQLPPGTGYAFIAGQAAMG